MTILQVEEAVQSLHEFIVHLAIDVPIGLLGIVAIILVVGQQLEPFRHLLHPFHESEVIAVILIPSATQDGLDVIVVVIDQRGHKGKEVVVHLLLADQVALHLRIATSLRIEPGAIREILYQLAACLVLLVVAVSLRVMSCHIQGQMV